MEDHEPKPMKKPVKLGLWLLGFALLAVLGLWLEHERAKARLAAYKAQLVAKGEKLAIADHVPKLPPALSNAAPDFIAAANALTELKPELYVRRMHLVTPGRARVTWQQPELPTDKDADLWPIVTAHVEENRDRLAEMTAALARPEMVVNLDYSKGFTLLLPHVQKVRQSANLLGMAVIVDLHAGQTNRAFTNLLASVRLLQRNGEPVMISQLVRFVCGSLAQQATWEGLQHTGWTDAQLRELQQTWQATDLAAGWLGAMGMERAMGSYGFQQSRGNPSMMANLGIVPGPSGSSFFEELVQDPAKAASRAGGFGFYLGWALWLSYPDEQWMLEQHQVWREGFIRMTARQSVTDAEGWMKAQRAKLVQPPRMQCFLSSQITPALESMHKKLANAEIVRRLTYTAIALHRHRLKHGKFTESLGALVPEYLAEVPRDFMDGQPLRYQLQPDGQFRLWSVGDDFKDDGGDPTPVGVASSSNDPYSWLKGRDWVWPQAASEAEVAAYHAELAAKRTSSPPKITP
ncbi:MAG: hypothetical protein EBS05_10790 [Proteobacteria bacterium]|nr:hypothetical protein [Pseudomonadota bacterium]